MRKLPISDLVRDQSTEFLKDLMKVTFFRVQMVPLQVRGRVIGKETTIGRGRVNFRVKLQMFHLQVWTHHTAVPSQY